MIKTFQGVQLLPYKHINFLNVTVGYLHLAVEFMATVYIVWFRELYHKVSCRYFLKDSNTLESFIGFNLGALLIRIFYCVFNFGIKRFRCNRNLLLFFLIVLVLSLLLKDSDYIGIFHY